MWKIRKYLSRSFPEHSWTPGLPSEAFPLTPIRSYSRLDTFCACAAASRDVLVPAEGTSSDSVLELMLHPVRVVRTVDRRSAAALRRFFTIDGPRSA
ncbi:hypothetical protein GCM10010206_30240 [Streptomyces cinerochromogenes]|nr:hypothetical protein GCM10010206_30240 [Streptomyces cinerochromogenes]